jgi:hypothetical protein
MGHKRCAARMGITNVCAALVQQLSARTRQRLYDLRAMLRQFAPGLRRTRESSLELGHPRTPHCLADGPRIHKPDRGSPIPMEGGRGQNENKDRGSSGVFGRVHRVILFRITLVY